MIAEIKRRSPSAGPLAPGLDAAVRARLYADHGAAAISVLTDRAFDGDLADLSAVAAAVPVPVLRKDFLVDPYQVWESRAAGADAALLIAAAVDDVALGELLAVAKEADLGLLVEVHSAMEADRALAAGAQVIGVNSRDLATLEVAADAGFDILAALRSRLGPDAVLVAESGIRSAEDVARARLAGADAVLVGERLMRAEDPGAALAELVQAGAGRP
ncbi:indole-3-glycerol phosphate synthase TrpC [soil metagenome]